MDGFNDTDGTGFYTTTASGEFYGYPIKTSVPGWVEVEVPVTLPSGWGLGGWPDCAADPQTSLGGEADYTQHHYSSLTNQSPQHIFPESTPLATSYREQTQDYNQSLFVDGHQPAASWNVQSSPFGVMDREGYFANGVESGVPVVATVPDNSKSFSRTPLEGYSFHRPLPDPFGYRGLDQSGPSGFHTSTQNSYEPSITPTKTRMIDEWRTETYLAHCAGSDEPANAEAGPSNFVPQHTPYMAQPPTNPSGGLSETTADAENHNKITEEDVVPRRKSKPRARTRGSVNLQARLYAALVHELRDWAEEWERLPYTPTHERVLEIALEAVSKRNVPVSQAPRLAGSDHRRTAAGRSGPDGDYQRRRKVRRLNEELSKYFVLPQGVVEWTSHRLISRVLRDVKRA